MDKKTVFILTLLGSGAVMFLIFYLYPAEIFDATLIGKNLDKVDASLCMKTFLFKEGPLPDDVNAANVVEIRRSLSGWMILFICIIGLPAMISYRVAYADKPSKEKLKEEDHPDQ